MYDFGNLINLSVTDFLSKSVFPFCKFLECTSPKIFWKNSPHKILNLVTVNKSVQKDFNFSLKGSILKLEYF